MEGWQKVWLMLDHCHTNRLIFKRALGIPGARSWTRIKEIGDPRRLMKNTDGNEWVGYWNWNFRSGISHWRRRVALHHLLLLALFLFSWFSLSSFSSRSSFSIFLCFFYPFSIIFLSFSNLVVPLLFVRSILITYNDEKREKTGKDVEDWRFTKVSYLLETSAVDHHCNFW